MNQNNQKKFARFARFEMMKKIRCWLPHAVVNSVSARISHLQMTCGENRKKDSNMTLLTVRCCTKLFCLPTHSKCRSQHIKFHLHDKIGKNCWLWWLFSSKRQGWKLILSIKNSKVSVPKVHAYQKSFSKFSRVVLHTFPFLLIIKNANRHLWQESLIYMCT